MLSEKILNLRERIIGMSALVEEMIGNSLKGLLEHNLALLTEVIERYEPRVNEIEIEMDELCANLIALYEPKARELRLILTALKMTNDLERIGDHAVNIAESSLYLIERPPVKAYVDIPKMANLTMAMIRDSITAFIKEDTALATEILQRDDLVDALRLQILRELAVIMSSEPGSIERALHLDRISANLERAADLSTNISEDVIYMVDGRVVKHHLQQ